MDAQLEATNISTAQINQSPARRRNGFLPALTLFFLAPLVGEVLLGSTPLDIAGSPVAFVVVFALETLLYGGGAILIREVARRTGHGWPTILGLGLAYGILEEGLVTQSLFNGNYLGYHLLASGNFLGLGWTWITYVLGLHVVWSTTVPIALTELLFRKRGVAPWLGGFGLTVAGVLFVLGALLLGLASYANGNFLAPWYELVGALIAAAVVATVAVRLPKRTARSQATAPDRAPSPWLVGGCAFVIASLFMGIHHFSYFVPDLPGILEIVVSVGLTVAMYALVLRWSAQPGWSRTHLLALAAAALFTYAWSGFFNIAAGDQLDLIGQIVIDVLAVLLVLGLARSLAARPVANPAS